MSEDSDGGSILQFGPDQSVPTVQYAADHQGEFLRRKPLQSIDMPTVFSAQDRVLLGFFFSWHRALPIVLPPFDPVSYYAYSAWRLNRAAT